MADTTTGTTTPQTGGSSAGTSKALILSRGTTTIADAVVTKVAGIAAREVPGVYALGGSSARAIGNVTQRVGMGANRGQGVSVEVAEGQATVEVTVVVEYGESIPQVTETIRGQVVKRVEAITGMTVAAVDITVDDLHFAGDDDTDQPA